MLPIVLTETITFALKMISIMIFTFMVLVEALNDSDIIITHAGHSDLDRVLPEKKLDKEEIQNVEHNADSDVVFMPNVEIRKNNRPDDYYSNIVTERIVERTVTEKSEQSKDVIFITGKNNDDVDKTNKRTIQKPSETGAEVLVRGKEKHNDVVIHRKNMPLDCSNVICNNTLHSLCGKRNDEGTTKFRMFRNECYFRKVNCEFKDEFNSK